MIFIKLLSKCSLLRYKIVDSKIDLKKWISAEEPYEYFNDEDKIRIRRIGTTLNNQLRRGDHLCNDDSFEIFNRLIRCKQLRKPIVVFRGQDCIDYEVDLAKKRGLEENYLYYDAFVYTALFSSYYNRNTTLQLF